MTKLSLTAEIKNELGRQIQGGVYDFGDQEYSKSIEIDNSRVEHEPLLVIQPDSIDDVRQIVLFCKKHKIKVTTKSGGHSATGYSLNSNGVVIDLTRMNQVKYSEDMSSLTVGAGARWIDVYNFLGDMQDKRIAIGGGCPGVGVGGFLLGSGYSFLSRSFGLGSDNVNEIEFTTSNGKTIVLSESSKSKVEKDLFWALQGSGGGNYGIATKFELKLHEVAHPLMVGRIVFPFYRIDDVLPVYESLTNSLPNEMAVYGMMRSFPDPRNESKPILSLSFTPIFNGDYQDGIDLLKPLLEISPITSEFHNMTLPQWENFIGSATKVSGKSAYIKSVTMEHGGLQKSLNIFKYHMARKPSTESYIVWTHMGGKISEPDRESCFPHRNSSYTVEVKSIWEKEKIKKARENIEWAHNFFGELENFATGAYINYIDPLLSDWQQKYYGESYDRLLQIKESVDPDNFFLFQQGVGSKFEFNDISTSKNSYTALDLSPLYRTF